jgi:excisionase family DNA binding protein
MALVEDHLGGVVTMADEPLVLTADQVAEKLQIEPRAVIRLRNQRKLAFVKIGSQLRFRIEDVEDYLRRSLNPCREQHERLGSEKNRANMSGTSIGTTRLVDGTEEEALARKIAAKLKKR